MPGEVPFRLTAWLTWTRVRRSVFNAAMAAALPAAAALAWAQDSFATAQALVLGLTPYVFLFLSRDAVRTELRDGSLESVLFLDGSFRRHLARKPAALAAIGAAYALPLFAATAFGALLRAELTTRLAAQCAASLAAGLYYVCLGCALSFRMDTGANVLSVVVAQAGLFVALLFSSTRTSPFLDALASGRFDSGRTRVEFLLFLAVFPNFAAQERFLPYALWVGALALGALAFALRSASLAEVRR